MEDTQVRNHPICIGCKQPKEQGLVLCWPCHRKQKRLNDGDYSPRMKAAITALEQSLASKQEG